MHKKIITVLDRIHEMDLIDRAERKIGKIKSIEKSIWALHPETAKLLNILIKWKKPKLVIELGCSYGYSTIWIAEAVHTYGGKLLSIENNSFVAEIARNNVNEADLSDHVEFLIGDCFEELKQLKNKADFLFCDIWDALYPKALPIILPVINQFGIIAFDNVSKENSNIEKTEFRKVQATTPEIQSINIGIGNGGLELCLKS